MLISSFIDIFSLSFSNWLFKNKFGTADRYIEFFQHVFYVA